MSWEKHLKDKKRPLLRGEGRIAVIAHAEKIRQAISEGYTYKAIYEAMKKDGLLKIAYHTFVDHINRHIVASEQKSASGVNAGIAPNEKSPAFEKPPTFQYNPRRKKDHDLS